MKRKVGRVGELVWQRWDELPREKAVTQEATAEASQQCGTTADFTAQAESRIRNDTTAVT